MNLQKILFCLFSVSLIGSVCLAQDKEKEPLARPILLKWRVGERLHYRKTVTSKTTGGEEGEEDSLEVESKMTSYWTQEVLAIDDKGVATLKIQFTRFVSSVAGKGAVLKQELDTDAFEKTKSPNGHHYFLQALLKIPFTLKMNRLGYVTAVKGLDSGVDKFLRGTKKISDWEGKVYRSHWNNKDIAVIWNNTFHVFVKQALRPKMNWKQGPVLAFNGTTYLNEDKRLTLQSLRLKKNKASAVIAGIGSQSDTRVDPALNTRGKDKYSTRLKKSRFRLVIDVDKGVVQQFYGTRSYVTDWIDSDITVFAFAVDETTTVQLRRSVKETKK